jgi:hypothetical protein
MHVTTAFGNTLLAVRATVVSVKLHCPVKVCNKLSDCLSGVGCASAKKIKHRRVGKIECIFLWVGQRSFHIKIISEIKVTVAIPIEA